jgi:hypothetical protein
MNASYNITNDRLKFTPDTRLPDELYKQVKAAGFQWWPGQKVFTKVWTPEAEDLMRTLGYTIDEDDTPDDLEARVNRFQNYAANDEATAASAAERVHTATTERRARMAESTAARALDEALYWQRRIAGAIQRAQYRDQPAVIARRIKGLQADLRKWQRAAEEHTTWSAKWAESDLSDKRALQLANYDPGHFYFTLGDTRESSMWSALNDGRTNAANAAFLMIEAHAAALAHARRWIAHLTMRIDYETEYLKAVGGEALLNPEPKPRRVAQAPEDGLKKGDIVTVPWGYGQKTITGPILSMGAKNIRVECPPELNRSGYYSKGYEVARRYAKKVTE